MMYIKAYAWFMEGIVPIPVSLPTFDDTFMTFIMLWSQIGRFKLGASSLVEVIPFMGAIGIFITSFLMYLRTCQSISAPSQFSSRTSLVTCLIADGLQVMWRVS